ncbi:hypothetical protein G3M53_32690 [Streptomyces sp. SID7982]|nr:hypothetical protein [Streptomyces sp. SID7982]
MSTQQPYRAARDPKCTVWTEFAALRVGDRVDYWGASRPVTEMKAFDDGRVRIHVHNGIGQDVTLAPGDENTWREPRDEEFMEASRRVLQAAMKEAFPDKGPDCCGHVTCNADGEPCGYIVLASAISSIRCDCTGHKDSASR